MRGEGVRGLIFIGIPENVENSLDIHALPDQAALCARFGAFHDDDEAFLSLTPHQLFK